jgi:hypothetical protein
MSAAGRRFPRHSKKVGNIISTDWEAIGMLVSGQEFVPPNRRQTMGSRYDLNVITFGARVDDEVPPIIDAEAEVKRRGFHIDEWTTVDHSVSGFRLQRKHPGSAHRTPPAGWHQARRRQPVSPRPGELADV